MIHENREARKDKERDLMEALVSGISGIAIDALDEKMQERQNARLREEAAERGHRALTGMYNGKESSYKYIYIYVYISKYVYIYVYIYM